MEYDLPFTPALASVYSESVASSWIEINFLDTMTLLYVLNQKTRELGFYGEVKTATDQVPDDGTSDTRAKLLLKVGNEWTQSQARMAENGWLHISGTLSVAHYERKIHMGDILEESSTTMNALHRAYYKKHNEVFETKVNTFDREVSTHAWSNAMNAYLKDGSIIV